MQRTWATIKEIIGSEKSCGTLFPKWLIVHDLETFDKKAIVGNLSIEKDMLPDKLEIANVTPLFKKGNNALWITTVLYQYLLLF